ESQLTVAPSGLVSSGLRAAGSKRVTSLPATLKARPSRRGAGPGVACDVGVAGVVVGLAGGGVGGTVGAVGFGDARAGGCAGPAVGAVVGVGLAALHALSPSMPSSFRASRRAKALVTAGPAVQSSGPQCGACRAPITLGLLVDEAASVADAG